jgi:hypothetical protein
MEAIKVEVKGKELQASSTPRNKACFSCSVAAVILRRDVKEHFVNGATVR